MATQTANNVLAALKRESTFGTAAGASSADRIRALDSPGLKKTRSNIASAERRSDLTQNMGRLGSTDVAGSFTTEINPGGEFDLLLESLARGTIGSLAEVAGISAGGSGVGTKVCKIETPAIPINTSYTIEQYDIDTDLSETFVGCRLTGADFSFQPNEMATVTWTFQGVDRSIETTGGSPYFTTPALTTGLPLIADDSVLKYKGSAVTKITGMNITVEIEAASQATIGSTTTPDIFMNMLRVTGDISAVREDLQAATDFDAGTEFAIQIALEDPTAAPKLTFGIIMPRVKLIDVDAPFSGGDAAKIETRQFTAHAPAGASNVIEFYTSTETATIV